MTDYPLTRDFLASEFRCSHCGASGIHQAFVEHLQQLRDALGKPVVVVSGYRCPRHPVEAAKPIPGQHTHGIAADIRIVGGTPREAYLRILREFPVFTGIGASRYRNTLHVDTRPIPAGQRAVVWAYDRNGNQARWRGRWEELPT